MENFIWVACRLACELHVVFAKFRTSPQRTSQSFLLIQGEHNADNQMRFAVMPRYVRINTLKSTKENVVSTLRKNGFKNVRYTTTDYDEFIEVVKSLEPDQFTCDIHFGELLIFHPKCVLFRHPLYENGTLILQDKASLLPATLLGPKPGSLVLDCCAAPGLKTSHIAALTDNQCSILASDRCPERMESMKSIADSLGVTCAEMKVAEFSSLDPQSETYRNVRYILLDPSCSGTGMVKSRNISGDDSSDISFHRLKSLANFQSALLHHAMTFPKVKRISYSTCSIHSIENEEVVIKALEKFGHLFQLVKQDEELAYTCFYDNRDKYSSLSGKVLKTIPDRDLTNGFFVAIFQRIRKAKKTSV